MINNLPIVVIAYNRPECLRRILNSIAQANYGEFTDITLIISIDFHPSNASVLRVAENFKWIQGEKIIKNHSENLGLRRHVLECGDYSLQYGSAILLEDDLYLSSEFYSFAFESLEFSEGKKYIGGVSLYNHQLNEQTFRNFSPIEDGFDNWYLQFAASWGQCWTKEQWTGFKEWYALNQDLEPKGTIPRNVTDWSEKSWLKFYIAYLIETNKFFLYPKISLSTNFSAVGTHNFEGNTAFQVTLRFKTIKKFHFSELRESNSVYDSFFENILLAKYLNLDKNDCSINLYGFKPEIENKRYLLTTKKLPYKINKRFGLSLKPIDLNIIHEINGDDIYLYDLSISEENEFTDNRYQRLIYNYKTILRKDAIYLFLKITSKSFKNLISRFKFFSNKEK